MAFRPGKQPANYGRYIFVITRRRPRVKYGLRGLIFPDTREEDRYCKRREERERPGRLICSLKRDVIRARFDDIMKELLK